MILQPPPPADREVNLDSGSWRVMDSYLEQAKRATSGQNASYDLDAFKHKEYLAKTDRVLAADYRSRRPAALQEKSL